MKYVGTVTDIIWYKSGNSITRLKCLVDELPNSGEENVQEMLDRHAIVNKAQDRRIYSDEVPMATNEDLAKLDDRIFLREMGIIQGL